MYDLWIALSVVVLIGGAEAFFWLNPQTTLRLLVLETRWKCAEWRDRLAACWRARND